MIYCIIAKYTKNREKGWGKDPSRLSSFLPLVTEALGSPGDDIRVGVPEAEVDLYQRVEYSASQLASD